MRNPFARVAKRETAYLTLRERLTATKAKAKQVLAVNKALMAPLPKPAFAVEHTAQQMDSGKRQEFPSGGSMADAGLSEASDDLARIDRAIDGLLTGSGHREGGTLPGYGALGAGS